MRRKQQAGGAAVATTTGPERRQGGGGGAPLLRPGLASSRSPSQLEQRLVLALVLASFVAVQLWLAFPLHSLSSRYLHHTPTTSGVVGYYYYSTNASATVSAAVSLVGTDLGDIENKQDGNGNGTRRLPPPPSFWVVPESFHLHSSFPRWVEQPPRRHSNKSGIQLSDVLEYLDDLLLICPEQQRLEALPMLRETFVYVWGATAVTADDTRAEAAKDSSTNEQQGSGIWVSENIRSRILEISHKVLPRLKKVEAALQRAWTDLSLRLESPEARERWPRLVEIAKGSNSTLGFPVLIYHGDFRSCNLRNHKQRMSVPVFTTCAHVHCNHSIPFPNYATIQDSLRDSRAWDALFQQEAASHPWSEKVRQVVWRGSLTGRGSLDRPSPRIRLGLFAGAHRYHPLLDVGIHKVHGSKNFSSELLRQVGMKPPIPYGNFSNYLAILDIDGNSWSSRFGKLLCTNSVIMKVEPAYVDYFYKYLEPWKHFVPVRSDLSDLLEKVEWVLDSTNDDAVRQIVRRANRWCRLHMTHDNVVRDMLDVLNEYVGLLDRGDARWMDAWAGFKAQMFHPASGWEMRKLEKLIEARWRSYARVVEATKT